MSIVRFTQVNSGYSFEIETVSENTIIVGEIVQMFVAS